MKKKVIIWFAAIVAIAAIVIAVLYSTHTLPADQVAGTIKKTERYRKTQTIVGDILLAPDVLNDKETGQQLALNILQLSYITENIADQTEEILSRMSATSIPENEKLEISNPLSGYHEMIRNNTQLMRKSSEDILAYLESETKETSGDLDKTFQDIGGFFNRYKTDNNVFTEAISTVESMVADNSDMLQNEAPSDLEIIRDKLYAVAYLNANFLQEKEIKKELLAKIVAQTETVDENPNAIIYNNQVNAFHAVNAQTGTLGFTWYNPLSSSLSNYENGVSAQYILLAEEGLNIVPSNATESLSNLAESMDAITLRSMAFSSMEKYSGIILMNTDDLKSILSTDQLRFFAQSPLCSLSKGSIAQLNALNIVRFNSQEAKNIALGLNVENEAKATEGMNLVNAAEAINLVNSMEGMNLQLEMSTLGSIVFGTNSHMNEAMNMLLESSSLQYMAAGSEMQAITLTGTFDMQSGIFSQIGLDFLPGDLGLMMSLGSQDMLSARVSPYINSSLKISY